MTSQSDEGGVERVEEAGGLVRQEAMICKFTISSYAFHSRLVTRVVAGTSAIPFTAIISWPVAETMCGDGVDIFALGGVSVSRCDSVMLKRSISLKSSPQLARPASIRCRTAAWKERTESQ